MARNSLEQGVWREEVVNKSVKVTRWFDGECMVANEERWVRSDVEPGRVAGLLGEKCQLHKRGPKRSCVYLKSLKFVKNSGNEYGEVHIEEVLRQLVCEVSAVS